MTSNFLDLTNARFVDDIYRQWTAHPESVDGSWQSFFTKWEDGDETGGLSTGPAAGLASTSQEIDAPIAASEARTSATAGAQSRVDSLLWAYRDIGYVHADINPLRGYSTPELHYMFYTMEGTYESLDLSSFGLSDADLEKEFNAGRYLKSSPAPLKEIVADLEQIYCSTLGAEILHIQNKPMRRWLIEKLESPRSRREWTVEQKRRFQKDLIKAEEFEHFLHSNFIGQKRFSLEGSEALIPGLRYLIDTAAQHGLQEIVLGMSHRGRLNVFTNALRKPAVETFASFEANYQPQTYGGSGDVKYHLGHSFDLDLEDGKSIHISLVANPSHLESVDLVVQGKCRGIQRRRGDRNRKKVLPVLIHGDAAFSGQGIVAETFNLSQLKGYRTGGTVHIIVNNQIGFTTASRDARSTFFATDGAKILPVPIFHANGDDPEAVVRAIDLAMRYRQKFGYDSVVDIQCYRRLGHNEADEPSFSHPLMYEIISSHPNVSAIYGERVDNEGSFPLAAQADFRGQYINVLKQELQKARDGQKPDVDDTVDRGEWSEFSRDYTFDLVETGVAQDRLDHIADALTTIPEEFNLHDKLRRFVSERRKNWRARQNIDWAFAESLAFGSIVMEGHPIRLSGEDCGRGTFSQRHAVWWDVSSKTPKQHVPLRDMSADQGNFSIYDSPLSEYAVLGFDYGYSLAQPNILVLWEAQFGDFANGAQVIIDQFIAAGESKWFRSSGLVMLLPHGYEGQGPEHSSAHLERFLQLCAEDNMQICVPSTPAQYFHVLRRQMKQAFRKPLILMTPKSLLRHKQCVSTPQEMSQGSFRNILDDPTPAQKTDRILFCSGKVYYDLLQRREDLEDRQTTIIRVEQLYPFDSELAGGIIRQYEDATEIMWVQEESENRGAWWFIRDRLHYLLPGRTVRYVGRLASPSPATGSFRQHKEELETILSEAFATGE